MDQEIEDLKIISEYKIKTFFLINRAYPNSFLKRELQRIYDETGIKRKVKATDLGKWFELKRQRMKDINSGKLLEGLFLTDKK